MFVLRIIVPRRQGGKGNGLGVLAGRWMRRMCRSLKDTGAEQAGLSV